MSLRKFLKLSGGDCGEMVESLPTHLLPEESNESSRDLVSAVK